MKKLLLLLLTAGVCFAQNARTLNRKPLCSPTVTTNCVPNTDTSGSAVGAAIPTWRKYALVKLANGAGGCASANGCWQINGVLGAVAEADLSHDVVLFSKTAKGAVTGLSVKTAVACAGATTISLGVGTATSNVFYRAATYDLKAAVADTNVSDTLAAPGRTSAAAENVTANVTTTDQNVSQITAGCAVDVWVLWAVLP